MVDIKTGWKSKDWQCIEPKHFVQNDGYNFGILVCNIATFVKKMREKTGLVVMAWTNSRTKEYIVPLSDVIAQNKVHRKYIARHNSMSELSFLEWLRSVDHTKPNGLPYKRGGSTLVSVKMVSPFKNEYFFQHILMNFACCTHTDLYHDQHAHLPNQICFFAVAMLKMPKLWGDDERITAHFQTDGNKQYYIETLQCHISSLCDVLCLWEREVITSNKLFPREFATPFR